MAKDRVGNELKPGDLVDVQYMSAVNPAQSVTVMGRVINIRPGGTMIATAANLKNARKGGDPEVTPGVVTVHFGVDVPFDPYSGVVPQIVKLVDPNPPEEKAGATKMVSPGLN